MYERSGIFLLENKAAFEEYKRAGRQIKIIISLLEKDVPNLENRRASFFCVYFFCSMPNMRIFLTIVDWDVPSAFAAL